MKEVLIVGTSRLGSAFEGSEGRREVEGGRDFAEKVEDLPRRY